MNLFHFSAGVSLTKTFTKLASGDIEKSSYPDVYRVTSHCDEVHNMEQFHAVVKRHALLGHCLVKGNLSHDLVDTSRAGTTDTSEPTQWVCLDIDGLATKQSIDEILAQLGITDTTYLLQYSSSQGIMNNALRCHVMLMLSKPVPAPFLKQWLMQLNLTVPLLDNAIKLSRSTNYLSWPLDISTCQNDKLIFTAPPILNKVRSPMKDDARYKLVRGKHETFTLPANIHTVARNKELAEAKKIKLRQDAGLSTKKAIYKTVRNSDAEVLSKPDQAIVTVARIGGEFTYVNLNGGDSAAYFHPTRNAEVIYNFKGEPNYLTKELDPDYWKQANAGNKTQAAKDQATHDAAATVGAHASASNEILHLAFRDKRTSVYHHGTYDPKTDLLDLDVAKNEKQVRDYCMQYDLPIGDYVPIWEITFDPNSTQRIDIANKTINTFQASQYMRAKKPSKPVTLCPPTILKVITHMLGGEQEIIDHFINWLAFIVQRRTKTDTAWVLYGTEGTGKGLMMKRVLRPLLGENQTRAVRASMLEEKYNDYMKGKLLVFYDEAHIPNMKNPEGVMEKLRNFITEDPIEIRAMYSNSSAWANYCNNILGSNKPDAIILTPNDRRWNIGRYQHDKLLLTEREKTVLDEYKELQAFHDFLAAYPLDEVAAHTPLATADRTNMITTTNTGADEVAQALSERHGSFEFFVNQLPTDNSYMSNAQRMNQVEDYRAVLTSMYERTDQYGGCKISRDELRTLFEFAVGGTPGSPHKFTKYLAHRHLHTKKVWVDSKAVYGIDVVWQDYVNFAELYEQMNPMPKIAASKTATKALSSSPSSTKKASKTK